jgi:hypothetical protein
MQQTPPRFSPIRSILFPYNGEEPLSRQQSWRVILTWALFFTFPMLLCTLLVTLFANTPLLRMALLLLIVTLSGIVIFGASAWFIVSMFNRSAQLRKQDNAKTGSTNGGRYGS